jgi:phosphopantetheinyl transferase
MFHGPVFQGVASIDAVGEEGADATLRAPDVAPLHAGADRPLAIEPLLLDVAGQVLGFWTAERLDTGFVVFPVAIETLALHGPPPRPGERVACHLRVRRIDDHQIVADIDVVASDGRMVACVRGWAVERVDLPEQFYAFRLAPSRSFLSTPLAELAPGGGVYGCRVELPARLLEAEGGLWREMLAHLVLGADEREVWRGLTGPEQRRTDWLLGRIAAKDAVRLLLDARERGPVYPADIEIAADVHGRPIARGEWLGEAEQPPVVSLAHADGLAVAVAGAAALGVDVERRRPPSVDLIEAAFGPDERRQLAAAAADGDWALRCWCAKEALAKALGRGLVAGPRDVVVEEIGEHEIVRLRLGGELMRVFPERAATPMTARTFRHEDAVMALAILHSDEPPHESRRERWSETAS